MRERNKNRDVLLGAGNEPHGVIAAQFATSLKSASWLFGHSLSQGPGPSRSEIPMYSCTFYDYHVGIPKGSKPNRMLRAVGPIEIESEQLDTVYKTFIGYPVYYEIWSTYRIVLHPSSLLSISMHAFFECEHLYTS